ncbi:hypothetical protein F5Y03DRAFT_400519 [Xylaria venustula]|nr:hypothetical protein F5Y03DRAFT_400519 [Xylaria venustula]
MAHGKHKAKGKHNAKGKPKPTKTERLNYLYREYQRLEGDLVRINEDITTLEAQYQVDSTGRAAYKKSTYNQLSSAYNSQTRLQAELQTKWAEYKAVLAEPESSSDESKTSGLSGSLGAASSSRSSAPAIIGWDCSCGRNNFTDPWGPDNWCGCGHQFCDDNNHCTVQ